MKRFTKGLPSLFTCLGLVCGCMSIVVATIHKDLNLAGYLILAAAVFDFIDGFVARIFNAISEFGKQLDSLADVVSFGVAPAMILYELIIRSFVKSSLASDFDILKPPIEDALIMYSAFLIAVFSALRLAKFNIDKEQVKSFRGLPTPANALFFAALGFISESSASFPMDALVYNRFFLMATIALSSYLLVCNIRMFSLKFATLQWKENSIRYTFLVFSLATLILLHGFPGLSAVIVLYILFSLINNRFVKMT